MTAEELHQIVNSWKNSTYLRDIPLVFNQELYSKALDEFWFDYLRWYPNDKIIDIKKLLLTPQLHGILTYRLASYIYQYINEDFAEQADLISNIGRINSQSEIFYSAMIGRGLKVNHGIGTVIGARCTIGENCTIHQNVTLGDKNGGRPTLGNNCMIYAGAKIIGNITIGDNCVIGANSVVMNSFPEGSVIAGIPARKIIK